ncbi:MAG: mRNA cleavage and polyadenylation specificity factor-like protein [Nanohaloarchaea archaeon SW_10_44_10]|nr:MAG: mRNA cleavage and polyadenylation specificity factor-like protein [Nanohaloarchaea archaeon SW_10_44_10]
MAEIKHRNGIRIEGETDFALDSYKGDHDYSIVSHAHADHALKKDSGAVICSQLTKEITETRFDVSIDTVKSEKVELMPSGHIMGSSAALINEQVLYTGDVATRDRAYIDGFDPVKAEELVIESTYGIPSYRFPDQREIEKEIKDWIKDTERPLFLFVYSLGKAQKIQHLVQQATDKPIIAHGAVKKMNDVIEENSDLDFRAMNYSENKSVLEDNSIMVAPTRCSQANYIENLVEKHGGIKAGFSGWAVNDSFKYKGEYDRGFPFSDHCDFTELVELVEQVDPEKVYTHHGFDEAFASYLSREKDFNARALKNNQSSLTDF